MFGMVTALIVEERAEARQPPHSSGKWNTANGGSAAAETGGVKDGPRNWLGFRSTSVGGGARPDRRRCRRSRGSPGLPDARGGARHRDPGARGFERLGG